MEERVKIYYFSGTGNSLNIANQLASELGHSEMISIADIMRTKKPHTIEGDVIGFVFPVYFARVPVVVEQFLEHVEFGKINHTFAVTNGGGLFGRTLKIFEKRFKTKGVELNAGYTIRMPGNHPIIVKMVSFDEEVLYDTMTQRIKSISAMVKEHQRCKLETNYGLIGYLMSYLLFYKLYLDSKKGELDKAFVLSDTCNGCGYCAQLCQNHNIELVGSNPVWKHNCINCLACYHYCPIEAIEFGEEKMIRYQNSQVTADMLFPHAK